MWDHMATARHLRSDRVGVFHDGEVVRRSNPLAVTQLVLTYYLVKIGALVHKQEGLHDEALEPALGGVLGRTTTPTLCEKAVAGSDLYDADIRPLAESGLKPAEIFEKLAVRDVQTACDRFLPTYTKTKGGDGFVSIEVSPELADDTAGT